MVGWLVVVVDGQHMKPTSNKKVVVSRTQSACLRVLRPRSQLVKPHNQPTNRTVIRQRNSKQNHEPPVLEQTEAATLARTRRVRASPRTRKLGLLLRLAFTNVCWLGVEASTKLVLFVWVGYVCWLVGWLVGWLVVFRFFVLCFRLLRTSHRSFAQC